MIKNKEDLKVILGEGVETLSSDQVSFITEKINRLVESQVEAKLSVQTEILEAEVKEKYDALLLEKENAYNSNLQTLEESLLQRATLFRDTLVEKTDKAIANFKKQSDETFGQYQTFMESRLDDYLEMEVSKAIPDTHVEALAKVAVLEPIVEGFKKVMQENYVKFDEESFGLLKDARGEIINLRSQLSEAVNESMTLTKQINGLERLTVISEVCDGLTQRQYERAKALLEGYDAEEIPERFAMIRSVILETEDSDSDDKGMGSDADTVTTSDEGSEEEKDENGNPVKSKSEKAEEDDANGTEGETEKIDEMAVYANQFKKLISR